MRVLLTTESYLPYVSGVTVSVDALARGLGSMGHEVLVLAPRPAPGSTIGPVGSPGPAPRHAWLESYQLPRGVPPGYRLPWPNPGAAALQRAHAFGPDVVHAHSPFVTGWFARRLAHAAGVPLVFTHHTRFADYGHYLGPFAWPGTRLIDAYLRRFWRRCAAIIAPSGDLATDIRARLDANHAERVRVIPTGVDTSAISALVALDPRVEAGWPQNSVVVGSLGRLAPEKSPELVLEAVAIGARVAPELRLLMVGGGPSAEVLGERASRADLANRVHFSGPRPRMEALARIAGTDLLLFASRTEAQGLVLAEVLAAGVPAVAVDGPGVRDSVRDGVDGLVVSAIPAHTVADRLAAAMVDLCTHPVRRRRMGARARKDAERFSVERRVGEVVALYEHLTRGAAGTGNEGRLLAPP